METLLRRERLIVTLGLLGICLLSWWYLVSGAGTGMNTLAMTTWQFPLPGQPGSSGSWQGSYWIIMFVMWWIMMIAMMVPSAAPTILLYVRVVRHHQKKAADAGPSTVSFLLGYLLAWLLFSLLATFLQWLLEQAGLVHNMMMWSTSPVLSGLFLLLAGGYQFTSLKNTCLTQCRSPAAWLSSHWRNGGPGALRMGLHHGLFCVGCCWGLMLLLFVGGVMNLVWIAGLAILVLLEKLMPQGAWLGRATGVPMLLAGVYLLIGSV